MVVSLFLVSAGVRVSDAAALRIVTTGIPSEVTGVTVRIIDAIHDPFETKFIVEAQNESEATIWKNYLLDHLPSVEAYNPAAAENPDVPPGATNINAKVGTWTKTIAQATTSITGLAAQPKAVFLFGSGLSGAAFGSFSNDGGLVFGFTDGTTQRCHGMSSQDGVSTSNVNQWFGDRTFYISDPAAAHTAHVKEKGSVAFTATGFDITWDATTLASVGGYLAIWGTDIANVAVKDFTIGTTLTGEKTYTGVGFPPDFGLIMSPVGIGGTIPVAKVDLYPCFSAKGGNATDRCWSAGIEEDDSASNPDAFRLQRISKMMAAIPSDGDTAVMMANFVNWNADGFVLNYTDAPPSSSDKFTGIFIKGGKWDAFHYTQPATAGTSPTGDVTTLLADSTAVPKAVMVFSVGNVLQTGASANNHSKLGIGATDGTTQVCTTHASNDGNTPTQTASRMYNDKLMVHTTAVATASSSTQDGVSTIVDMATAGQFKVNYSSGDGVLRKVAYIVLGA